MPLCVEQGSSQAAQVQFSKFSLAVWWRTYVEATSALQRLRRESRLTSEQFQPAEHLLLELRSGWSEIEPSVHVEREACLLLAKYPLKAGDALQLAAAIYWCNGSTAGRMFICGDLKLCDAAEAEGFDVIRL